MNTARVLQKNHPKWSRLDQEARKTSPMSKAASVAFNDQQFDGIEKVCKRLLKLSFGRDTTRCRHSPNLDRERFAKYRHSSNMAEHDFVTHIVTHHTLAKPQRSKPLQPNPLFKNNFLISFSRLTIFILTVLFRRRFDRTSRETRLTSRLEIRSIPIRDDPFYRRS